MESVLSNIAASLIFEARNQPHPSRDRDEVLLASARPAHDVPPLAQIPQYQVENSRPDDSRRGRMRMHSLQLPAVQVQSYPFHFSRS